MIYKTLLISYFLSFYCFAEAWPELSFPEKATVEVVADNMLIYGSKMKTWVVRDKSSQMNTAAFYKRQWKSNSEKFDARMFNGDYVINSLQPPYLLTARIKQEYDQTITFVGITKEEQSSDNKADIENFIPNLPETTILSDIKSSDVYKKGRTLVLANNRSVESNYHFYRNHFLRKGWVETTGILDNVAGKAALKMNMGTKFIDLSFDKSRKFTQTHIVINHVAEGE